MSSQGPLGDSDRAAHGKSAAIQAKTALEDLLLSAHRFALSAGAIGAFVASGLTVAEWGMLRTIGSRQDVPLKEVLAASRLSRQRIRTLLSDLQQKGLIISKQSSAGDKRARTVSATAKASSVLSSISTQMEELLSKTGQEKQGPKLVGVARSLDRLANQLRRSSRGAGPKGRMKSDDDDED